MKAQFFFWLTLTMLAVNYTKAQESKYPETVLIKIFESAATMGVHEDSDTKIITITPDNTPETKSLEKVDIRKSSYSSALINNQIKIKTEIQRWRNIGFHVKTSYVAYPVFNLIVTTIILEKD